MNNVKPLQLHAHKKQSCETCLFLVKVDDGYSNWSVEGTTNHCLLDKNPNMPEDNYYGYGENSSLRFICVKHNIFNTIEERIHIDVDRSNLMLLDKANAIKYTTNKKLKALLELNPIRMKEILSWKMHF